MRNRKLDWIKKINWGLTLILFLSLLFRLFKLNSLPYNFHEDEVLSGYIGRFILQNGKDIYGNPWPPFYFNKFGDYYIIGPIYLSGLSTFIFGINQFAVRFPSAFFGALLVIPIYLFAKQLLKDEKLALLSAFFYAISPWSIVLSRTTSEGVIGAFFFTLALVFLLKLLKASTIKNSLITIFLFLIGYFIYHPYRTYPPAIFITVLLFTWFLKIKLEKRTKKFLVFSFIFFTTLTLVIGSTKWGKNRFLQTSIFSTISGVKLKMQDLIFTEKTKNTYIVRLFHNKPWHYGRKFLEQYLTYFSPQFLLFQSWEKLRYFTPEQGVFYFTLAFLFYLGLAKLLVSKKDFEKSFLLLLLLLAPFPAGLTVVESPNPHRAFFMLVPASIIASLGVQQILTLKNKLLKKSLLSFFIFLLAFEFVYFWHQYSVHFDYFSALYRNDGQKEAANLLQKLKRKYDKVYISSAKAMSWYYLFYSKDFDKSLIGKFGLDAKIDHIGKIYFTKDPCPSNSPKTRKDLNNKIVVIDRPECASNLNDFKPVKTFFGKYSLLKYKILEPR